MLARRSTDIVDISSVREQFLSARADRMRIDNTIKHRLLIFSSFFENHPLPCWIKIVDTQNKKTQMWGVNDAYRDVVGILPNEYRGTDDDDHWTDAESDQFYENDVKAIKSDEPVVLIETWTSPITKEKLVGKFVLKRELKDLTNSNGVYAVMGVITGIRDAAGREVWPVFNGGHDEATNE